MEKIQTLNSKFKKVFGMYVLALLLVQCTTRQVMEDTEGKFEDINEEFNKVVQVVEPMADTKKSALVLSPKKAKSAKVKSVDVKPTVREPEFEDGEGFVNRRPILDPFYPGEKVVLSVNYFNVTAGELAMQVLPYKIVNGRKSYDFEILVESNKTFGMFYAIKNVVKTLIDYETLVPQTFTVDAKESSRIKESKTFFDWEKNEATIWEKVIKKDGRERKKKVTWPIDPYSQNIISAAYYLRAFVLTPGKKFAFRVADDEKNYTFNGEVLRREELKTELGVLKTVVVRPTFDLSGVFKPTGENLLWLTDDERKFLVRFESKIKIGTLVGRLKSIEKGTKPD